MERNQASILSGALLIAGTSIGGGMLALPVLTSQAGFIPSVFAYLLCWMFMAATGLLFLEISQSVKGESNIATMAEMTLGKKGKYFAWGTYLFLFYSLTIAYMVGCGNMIIDLTQASLPDWSGPLIFALLFAPLILVSARFIERFNSLMVAGLALCYCGFVFLGFRYIKIDFLLSYNWTYSLKVLPIAFTSFAYQGIIPTLASYMNHDASKIRKAILIGSFIPLVAYIIWEGLILGIVPLAGTEGLLTALENGDNAVYPLKYFIKNDFVNFLAQFFAFFALLTSFLGVTLGLRDFLADGLNIEKSNKNQPLLLLLVFLIPLLVAVSYPHVFLVALEYAGGFGCALLLGLLPILMVWMKRYHVPLEKSKHQLFGGKPVLIILGLFVSIELVTEVYRAFCRIVT